MVKQSENERLWNADYNYRKHWKYIIMCQRGGVYSKPTPCTKGWNLPKFPNKTCKIPAFKINHKTLIRDGPCTPQYKLNIAEKGAYVHALCQINHLIDMENPYQTTSVGKPILNWYLFFYVPSPVWNDCIIKSLRVAITVWLCVGISRLSVK